MEGSALKAMVSFFTIWQQEITQEDMDAMDRGFHLVPIVGALLGAAVLLITFLLVWFSEDQYVAMGPFIAVAALATVYIGSRFLHFDGLADFGDGSIVAGSQEAHVRALKDTLIGAGGLGVALTVTLFNFAEYYMVGALIVVFAPITEILVKNAQVAAAAYGIPSNGMAGKQVSETTGRSLVISTIISAILISIFGTIGLLLINNVTMYAYVEHTGLFAAMLVGIIGSILTGILMARRSNRVFGMVNGDILGATNEISRAVVMLLMFITYVLVV